CSYKRPWFCVFCAFLWQIIHLTLSGGKRTFVVLQPGYLPWLGFFDQLQRSDCFIFYDDVQYDKNGWRNRNRIKSTTGEPHWLTVPVRVYSLTQRLIETEIDNRAPWRRKDVGSLRTL